MKNIRIIKTGINVSKILKQLNQKPEFWNFQKSLPDTTVLDPHVYISEAAVLQLVIGYITDPNDYVFDAEGCMPTPAYYHHTETIDFLRRSEEHTSELQSH